MHGNALRDLRNTSSLIHGNVPLLDDVHDGEGVSGTATDNKEFSITPTRGVRNARVGPEEKCARGESDCVLDYCFEY